MPFGEADAIEQDRAALRACSSLSASTTASNVAASGDAAAKIGGRCNGRHLPLSYPICEAIGTITPSCRFSINRQPLSE